MLGEESRTLVMYKHELQGVGSKDHMLPCDIPWSGKGLDNVRFRATERPDNQGRTLVFGERAYIEQHAPSAAPHKLLPFRSGPDDIEFLLAIEALDGAVADLHAQDGDGQVPAALLAPKGILQGDVDIHGHVYCTTSGIELSLESGPQLDHPAADNVAVFIEDTEHGSCEATAIEDGASRGTCTGGL